MSDPAPHDPDPRCTLFISYSHDSDLHRERVLGLSERLRADGIDTSLDQYVNGTPTEGWPRWMLNQFDWVTCVLVVCTETYYRRFRGHEQGDKGKGVDWEGQLITLELYRTKSRTIRFVPVIFERTDEKFIPEPLQGYTFYLLDSDKGYEKLLDSLLNQDGVEPGKVGQPKRKPRRKGTPLTFMGEDGQAVKQKTPLDFLLSNIREPPKATNPGTLLNARYEVVPFFEEARTAELADLKAWCDDDRLTTSVRLFYGPGGTGKTRLMIEWAKQLRKQGWYAGFLPEQVGDDQVESILHTDKPTLMVLDYAECRTGLCELLKRIADRPAEQLQRLRVVLLARDVADWWQSLLQRDEAVRHLLVQAEPAPIAPVALAGPLRRRIWEHARDAFAARLQKSAPPGIADLEDERFGRILYLHMSALATVEGLGTKVESLIDEIAVHERHFWAKRYQEQFGKDDFEAADFDKRCSRLVAAVTLQGGVPSSEAAEALNRRVEGPAPRYQHLIPFLRRLYAGRGQAAQDRYLGRLEPDLLGEALVWSVLTDPENRPQPFLEQVFAGADEAALGNGFVVLG